MKSLANVVTGVSLIAAAPLAFLGCQEHTNRFNPLDEAEEFKVQEYRCSHETIRLYTPGGVGLKFTENGEPVSKRPNCLGVDVGYTDELGGEVR